MPQQFASFDGIRRPSKLEALDYLRRLKEYNLQKSKRMHLNKAGLDGFLVPKKKKVTKPARIQQQVEETVQMLQEPSARLSEPEPTSLERVLYAITDNSIDSLGREIQHSNRLKFLRFLTKPDFKKDKIKNYFVYGVAGIVIVLGSFVTWNAYEASQDIKQIATASMSVMSDDDDGTSTGETTPAGIRTSLNAWEHRPDVDAHQVASNKPRYFSSDDLGIDKARILELGLEGDGKLAVPDNIHDVGWYRSSIAPGQSAGAIVLDAHVHGKTIPGVFFKIRDVGVGRTFELENGDGTKYTYEVVERESVERDKIDMLKAMNPAVPGTEGVTLITCSGDYDQSERTHTHRTVVYAVRTN